MRRTSALRGHHHAQAGRVPAAARSFRGAHGLSFGPESRFSLERRLRERLIVLKLASFAEYHHYPALRPSAAAEWDEAIDLLTTNETYFFREERQLRAFQNERLAPAARGRACRVGAGSSSGARAARPARRRTPSRHRPGPRLGALPPRWTRTGTRAWDVRIYGSDISRRCVAAARARRLRREQLPGHVARAARAVLREVAGGWQVVAPCGSSAISVR